MFELLDIIGTLVFAISGALTAIYKKLDLFGVYCIAFVTALISFVIVTYLLYA